MKELWTLFATFFKIGICTFGGGYAMLPMLEREIVNKHGWATMEDLLDYFAIGQCTPGIIAVNTATFVGYKHKGVAGGITATLGVVAPSIVIITLIATVLTNLMEYEIVGYAFAGIRIAVCAMILKTVVQLAKSSVKKPWQLALAVAAFVAAALFGVSTIAVVGVVVAMAVVYYFGFGKKGGQAA